MKGRKNQSAAAGLMILALTCSQLALVSVPVLAQSTADAQLQANELARDSYEIRTDLPRQLSTAIGDGMEIFLQSGKKAPNQSAIDNSFGELRATIADIQLITDRPLQSKGTSAAAQKSWQELGDEMKKIEASTKKLGQLLYSNDASATDWLKVRKLADEITDALMTLDDPRNIVIEK